MVSYGYKGVKFPPLTEKEIEERYAEAEDEMKEVLEWKKEEEAKLEDESISPQKRGAAKRALVKVQRRINTVNGNILYWKLRKEGKTHFHANIERAEYWDKMNNPDRKDEESN